MVALILAAGLLSPNLGLAVWLAIAFGLLLVVLSKFAFPAIIESLRERETTIEEAITRAERANEEAQRLLAENDTARRDAEREAQAILRQAREDAEAARAAGVSETKAELAEMRDAARAEIEREKRQALAELRSEVATLAVGAAEKILKTNLDAGKQRALVDDFIADLPQN